MRDAYRHQLAYVDFVVDYQDLRRQDSRRPWRGIVAGGRGQGFIGRRAPKVRGWALPVKGGRLVISIRDNSIGLPAENRVT
jgi:hypothetical protein